MFKFLSFCLFRAAILPALQILGRRRGSDRPWVIGGHGGRTYADNSAALHRYIVENTACPVVWITSSPDVRRELSAAGRRVLRKNSLRARVAIWRAPVLVRSHGDGDLDDYLVRWNRPPGRMIMLYHCMTFLKAGQTRRRRLMAFDYLLASSEAERDNFVRMFPDRVDRIVLGGGAHLDEFLNDRPGLECDRSILYFPTFRDGGIRTQRRLEQVIATVVSNPDLLGWLRRTGRKLIVVTHINRSSGVRNENSDVVETTSTSRIADLLRRCEVFVSDYSGTICNALLVDKPVIFFPFDLDDYLTGRRLLVDYGDFTFGPVVRDVGDLVNTLTSETWLDVSEHSAARQRWSQRMFPNPEHGFARRCFETIEQLAAR